MRQPTFALSAGGGTHVRALTRRERAIPALPAVVLYFAGDGAALDPAAWRLPRAPSLAQGLGSLPRVQRMKAAGSVLWFAYGYIVLISVALDV